ncbi:MAG: hypothetical protein QOG89_1378 [Thermomicrobiales bacterium]|nr:hypothetical protein [Thermomicrobiales bacterium]
MANQPTSPKGTEAAPGANGKTGQAGSRRGAHDPKPGAAVKGKGRTDGATTSTPVEPHVRRAERRPDLIKKRREELRRIPEKRQKERLITRLVLGAAAALLVAAIVFSIYQWGKDRDLNQIPAGVQTYSYSAGQHDDAFDAWTESPPVGGTHNNVWQTCGFYTAPVGKGNVVHSLEHGAVWVTYKPDLPQDQIDELKKLADDKNYVLVSPYADQQSPVVATAWNHQLPLQSADDKALDQFIRVFMNNPKYTPEYGASCVGTDATV